MDNRDYWGETMVENEKKPVGKIVNYFNNIGVAIVELEDSLAVGDRISIEGATTKIQQNIESMQRARFRDCVSIGRTIGERNACSLRYLG